MEIRHFIDYMQCMLDVKQIELAKQFLEEMKPQIGRNSMILTLEMIFNIHETEMKLGESGFWSNKASIQDAVDCYEQLKFYLRRLDFDIYCDELEFVNYIRNNQISSIAIATLVQTSIIHKVEVLNKAAMILSEYDELFPALRLLDTAYAASKDDITLLNFSLVLWKYGDFENAEMVLNQIKESNDDVMFLERLIKEKVQYNG